MRVHLRPHRRFALFVSLIGVTVLHATLQVSVAQQKLDGMQKTQKEKIIRLSTELISLTVTVTDKQGRAVVGLNKEAFSVFDNGIKQEINFFNNTDAPVSVGIVFDVSRSMTESKIQRARDALAGFIQASHIDDEYSLISFNDRPRLLIDKVRDSDALLRRVSILKPSGNTALYEAIAMGINHLSESAYSKRTLIVLSDGNDNHSRLQLDQLRKRLQESDVMLYAIGARSSSASKITPDSMRGGFILDQLAEASGGKAFFPGDGDEMNEACEQIALELRRQYSLGFTPSNFIADGKWHRLKVRVAPPDESKKVVVRSRQGYFALPEDKRRNLPEVEE